MLEVSGFSVFDHLRILSRDSACLAHIRVVDGHLHLLLLHVLHPHTEWVTPVTGDAALAQCSLEIEHGHIGEGQPGGLPLHRGGRGTSARSFPSNFILESVQRLSDVHLLLHSLQDGLGGLLDAMTVVDVCDPGHGILYLD